MRMMPDFRAQRLHHGLIGVGHEEHRVRHAGVKRMKLDRALAQGDLLAQPQIPGRCQADGDVAGP